MPLLTGFAFGGLVTFTVQYLNVAGGGGAMYGGGGGGGAFLGSTTCVVGLRYPITVGAGGAAGASGVIPTNGGNSVFGALVAVGGGKGSGQWAVDVNLPAANSGGSGGAGGTGGGGAGTAGQGQAGGRGGDFGPANGGGGGHGGVGSPAPSDGRGGRGGAGLNTDLIGTMTNFAAGGGGMTGMYGADADQGAAGGASAGAGRHSGTPFDGATNRGGGGGGHWTIGASRAGNGGSGIIVLRIPDSRTASFSAGVTVTGGTPSGGFRTYTITAAGVSDTVTFN